MPVRTTATLATFLAAGLVPLTLPAASASAAPAKYGDDFNGDGYRDYAYASFSARGGGGVTVVYGTATGPGTSKQRITQSSPGVPGTDEADDMFGEVRAAADFDGDGYGDLAVAATGENGFQGAVTILWGSPSGLSTGTALPNKNPGRNNYMGKDLATGDFNGDGKQDLAVINESMTYVYRGPFKRSGTTGAVTKLDKTSSFYASALISGKVDGDKKTDLAIIGDVVSPEYTASDVWFIKGGATSLTPGKSLRLESESGNGGSAERGGDGVIADFNKDGYGDIAIGTPLYSKHKGRVSVWYGSSAGPSRSTRLTQATSGVAGTPENRDEFGSSIAAGDVNGDGYADLAVGVPGEEIDGQDYAGGVHVFKGRAGGLSGAGSQWFARNTPGVPGPLMADDQFGGLVRLRDTDDDGTADLYVSGVGSLRLPGSASGITTAGATDYNTMPIDGFLE
ncbi:FG-GAP and VCBS repeat-containing protein [Streptomyces collinus]|uniref:Integrin-like protein n=1 Tax=Streptomyces collinus (strain DSM 40733 / Tue 365) TaxID=1214242 RepID=S5VX87_STRC3|nr:FG-GAP-like repeat-containing protein [Streptomyces collinus]AGS72365.1 integrin-like protein [Streptomyces collinus Tu 365]UJA11023.1 integrin-like protein [Streptomyces collinus]UJA14113.1 integrin-like protein [Streptomyces collinus]